MSHLKHIFFDLDGTLVDSSKGIQESFEYSFKQLGKECPEESIIKSFMGPPLEVSFASVLEESQVPEAINYYRSFYKEKGIWGVRLYEGIPELLTKLKEAGYQIYVTTSKNQPTAQDLLANLAISEQFDDIFGSLPDSFHKADVLRRALQTLDANSEEISEILKVSDKNITSNEATTNDIDNKGFIKMKEQFESMGLVVEYKVFELPNFDVVIAIWEDKNEIPPLYVEVTVSERED